MRPIKLTLKGFTAFRDTTELDFEDLDVFAINGPTGSGKSSLLDAVTYALYGRVERVGDRVGQLISQGQPRMAVTLEFQVGHERYRVTRSTPAKGATKILLERREPDGAWQQAGEGADRVREAEPMIARAIGLTYDGFTRSVLLPQGRFAELLMGDAKKRRDILTELLGLSLFRRMAERAGAIGKEAGVRAQERALTVEREYADATADALKEAREAAKDAVERDRALAKACDLVDGIVERWREAQRSAAELRSCADQANAAAASARDAAAELADLSEKMDASAAEVDRRVGESKLAQEALDRARSALREAEATLGPVEDLRAGQLRAHTYGGSVRSRAATETVRSEVAAAADAQAGTLTDAERVLQEGRAALEVLDGAVADAEVALETARHADMSAALSAGLKIGDPCPVCGVPLERLPKRPSARGLKQATDALARTKEHRAAAHAELAEAERAAEAARSAVASNIAEQERLVGELRELDRTIEADGALLVDLLGDPLPADPADQIARRLGERERLDQEEREADRAATGSERSVIEAERERDSLASSIGRLGDRVATGHQAVIDRAGRALSAPLPAELPQAPEDGDVTSRRAFADLVAGMMAALADRLARELAGGDALEGRLLDEAREAARGVLDATDTLDSLDSLADALDGARRSAAAAVATTQQRSVDLAAKVDRKRQLVQEVKDLDHRSRLFKTLARELQRDHLIAYLQVEALQVLAAAGSDRLATLTDGRYLLRCEDDEFFVIDTWNAEERRSVRTLSGGETFLASLSLALALSEQVRSLSVTERARLDSLFLDEGFGSLDPESLRVVVDAIEQLGGDGRLVGVITHVAELAEQFPRIEVDKSPRGSRVRLVV